MGRGREIERADTKNQVHCMNFRSYCRVCKVMCKTNTSQKLSIRSTEKLHRQVSNLWGFFSKWYQLYRHLHSDILHYMLLAVQDTISGARSFCFGIETILHTADYFLNHVPALLDSTHTSALNSAVFKQPTKRSSSITAYIFWFSVGFFIPLKLKRGLCPSILGGYSGADAYRRETCILRACARRVWDNKEQKWAGMCVLGVPEAVQVSRRETWRKKRDPVCSLPKDSFRALPLSALLCFNAACLLRKPKLSFPKSHSVLQVLVHYSDHIHKV